MLKQNGQDSGCHDANFPVIWYSYPHAGSEKLK